MNMRNLINIMESVFDGPAEEPREFGQFKFIHIPRKDGSLGRIEIKHGPENKQIGIFSFVSDKTGGNTVSGHLAVQPGYKGKGLGINLYRIVMEMAKDKGLTLVPSRVLSDAAYAIWQKLNPSALKGYERSSQAFDDHHGHMWSPDPRYFPQSIREDIEHID